MTILAIDTSTDYLSLAIMRGEKIIARFHRRSRMRHSSLLMPRIDKLLKRTGLKIKEIDCFAISIGPGSFTGLRIGVATVKGLAYALKKPIVAVPTLDVIAVNAKSFRGAICPVLDARKNKVYACLYKSDGEKIKRISKYLLLPVSDLLKRIKKYDKIIFLGDVAAEVSKNFSKEVPGTFLRWHPRAEVVARICAESCKKKKFVSPEDLEPLYLYSKECDITGR